MKGQIYDNESTGRLHSPNEGFADSDWEELLNDFIRFSHSDDGSEPDNADSVILDNQAENSGNIPSESVSGKNMDTDAVAVSELSEEQKRARSGGMQETDLESNEETGTKQMTESGGHSHASSPDVAEKIKLQQKEAQAIESSARRKTAASTEEKQVQEEMQSAEIFAQMEEALSASAEEKENSMQEEAQAAEIFAQMEEPLSADMQEKGEPVQEEMQAVEVPMQSEDKLPMKAGEPEKPEPEKAEISEIPAQMAEPLSADTEEKEEPVQEEMQAAEILIQSDDNLPMKAGKPEKPEPEKAEISEIPAQMAKPLSANTEEKEEPVQEEMQAVEILMQSDDSLPMKVGEPEKPEPEKAEISGIPGQMEEPPSADTEEKEEPVQEEMQAVEILMQSDDSLPMKAGEPEKPEPEKAEISEIPVQMAEPLSADTEEKEEPVQEEMQAVEILMQSDDSLPMKAEGKEEPVPKKAEISEIPIQVEDNTLTDMRVKDRPMRKRAEIAPIPVQGKEPVILETTDREDPVQEELQDDDISAQIEELLLSVEDGAAVSEEGRSVQDILAELDLLSQNKDDLNISTQAASSLKNRYSITEELQRLTQDEISDMDAEQLYESILRKLDSSAEMFNWQPSELEMESLSGPQEEQPVPKQAEDAPEEIARAEQDSIALYGEVTADLPEAYSDGDEPEKLLSEASEPTAFEKDVQKKPEPAEIPKKANKDPLELLGISRPKKGGRSKLTNEVPAQNCDCNAQPLDGPKTQEMDERLTEYPQQQTTPPPESSRGAVCQEQGVPQGKTEDMVSDVPAGQPVSLKEKSLELPKLNHSAAGKRRDAVLPPLHPARSQRPTPAVPPLRRGTEYRGTEQSSYSYHDSGVSQTALLDDPLNQDYQDNALNENQWANRLIRDTVLPMNAPQSIAGAGGSYGTGSLYAASPYQQSYAYGNGAVSTSVLSSLSAAAHSAARKTLSRKPKNKANAVTAAPSEKSLPKKTAPSSRPAVLDTLNKKETDLKPAAALPAETRRKTKEMYSQTKRNLSNSHTSSLHQLPGTSSDWNEVGQIFSDTSNVSTKQHAKILDSLVQDETGIENEAAVTGAPHHISDTMSGTWATDVIQHPKEAAEVKPLNRRKLFFLFSAGLGLLIILTFVLVIFVFGEERGGEVARTDSAKSQQQQKEQQQAAAGSSAFNGQIQSVYKHYFAQISYELPAGWAVYSEWETQKNYLYQDTEELVLTIHQDVTLEEIKNSALTSLPEDRVLAEAVFEDAEVGGKPGAVLESTFDKNETEYSFQYACFETTDGIITVTLTGQADKRTSVSEIFQDLIGSVKHGVENPQKNQVQENDTEFDESGITITGGRVHGFVAGIMPGAALQNMNGRLHVYVQASGASDPEIAADFMEHVVSANSALERGDFREYSSLSLHLISGEQELAEYSSDKNMLGLVLGDIDVYSNELHDAIVQVYNADEHMNFWNIEI